MNLDCQLPDVVDVPISRSPGAFLSGTSTRPGFYDGTRTEPDLTSVRRWMK
jgi:hypothetical protein